MKDCTAVGGGGDSPWLMVAATNSVAAAVESRGLLYGPVVCTVVGAAAAAVVGDFSVFFFLSLLSGTLRNTEFSRTHPLRGGGVYVRNVIIAPPNYNWTDYRFCAISTQKFNYLYTYDTGDICAKIAVL